MIEKRKEPLPEELAAKRAALDRVLQAALAERAPELSLYDCAIWLLYACTRSDAITTAREFEEDEGEESVNTIAYECQEAIDLAMEGERGSYEEDIKAVGEQLDPDFEKPARELTDWLPPLENPASTRGDR